MYYCSVTVNIVCSGCTVFDLLPTLEGFLPQAFIKVPHLQYYVALSNCVKLFLTCCDCCILYLSQSGESPLHKAALGGHLDVCKVLCEYGADLSLKDRVSV